MNLLGIAQEAYRDVVSFYKGHGIPEATDIEIQVYTNMKDTSGNFSARRQLKNSIASVYIPRLIDELFSLAGIRLGETEMEELRQAVVPPKCAIRQGGIIRLNEGRLQHFFDDHDIPPEQIVAEILSHEYVHGVQANRGISWGPLSEAVASKGERMYVESRGIGELHYPSTMPQDKSFCGRMVDRKVMYVVPGEIVEESGFYLRQLLSPSILTHLAPKYLEKFNDLSWIVKLEGSLEFAIRMLGKAKSPFSKINPRNLPELVNASISAKMNAVAQALITGEPALESLP